MLGQHLGAEPLIRIGSKTNIALSNEFPVRRVAPLLDIGYEFDQIAVVDVDVDGWKTISRLGVHEIFHDELDSVHF